MAPTQGRKLEKTIYLVEMEKKCSNHNNRIQATSSINHNLPCYTQESKKSSCFVCTHNNYNIWRLVYTFYFKTIITVHNWRIYGISNSNCRTWGGGGGYKIMTC